MSDYVTTTSLTGTCSCCGGGCPCAYLATILTGWASGQISNDVGFITVDPASVTSQLFTATDGVTSLVLSASRTFGFGQPPVIEVWGYLNLQSGSITTISWSASGTGGSGTSGSGSIYLCDGTLVETVSNNTGSALVFSALSTTGDYLVYFAGGQESLPLAGTVTATATITSDATLAVNSMAPCE